MKYRKKSLLTEATQWFKNGDHPQDESDPIANSGNPPRLTNGKVVRPYQSVYIPDAEDIPENQFCRDCGNIMAKHGILDGLNGEEFVCPGDYIVTDRRSGAYYRLSRGEFESQYELYAPPPRPHHTEKALSDVEERFQRGRRV